MSRFVLLLSLLLIVAACGDGTTGAPPPPNVPFSTTDLVIGTGAAAANGQTLAVAYTGWLYDTTATENKGSVFDSRPAGNPFSFVLGVGQVIQGWDQGMVGLQVGGVRRIVIPPELGYGAAGTGPIPGNATLIFEVELLAAN